MKTKQDLAKPILLSFVVLDHNHPIKEVVNLAFPEFLHEQMDLDLLKIAICKVFHVDRCETLEDYNKEVEAENEHYRIAEEEEGL